jgi:hypothetical protein
MREKDNLTNPGRDMAFYFLEVVGLYSILPHPLSRLPCWLSGFLELRGSQVADTGPLVTHRRL